MPKCYASNDVVDGYIRGVLDGSIVVGRDVALCVKRHVADLRDGHKRGLDFDENAAQRVLDFFKFMRHSKGTKWAGKRFDPSPWQAFCAWVIFGWKLADGYRRFRTVYIEIGKKNGKSTFAAVIGLYMLIGDGEAGAEVYSAATKREQAKIVFEESKAMVERSPKVAKRITVLTRSLTVDDTRSKFEPLSADAKTMDGLNPHAVIIDEFHAHPTSKLFDTLRSAMGARTQPLMFIITTAGNNQESACYKVHEDCEKILDPKSDVTDDTVFAFMANPGKDDELDDREAWMKGNPNLGVSVFEGYLESESAKAMRESSYENSFRKFNMNQWVQQVTRWLKLADWDQCDAPVDPSVLTRIPCYGGLDLASRFDLCAYAKLWPDGEGGYDVFVHFWMPEEIALLHERERRIPYTTWADEGYVTLTPGNVTDHQAIQAFIEKDSEVFNIAEIGFDPADATQLTTNLMGFGLDVASVPQNISQLNEPSKELERQVVAHTIRHGGNPVLRWQAENVSIFADTYGRIRPVKPDHNAPAKIDGIAAIVTAMRRAMVAVNEESVYEQRDGITMI